MRGVGRPTVAVALALVLLPLPAFAGSGYAEEPADDQTTELATQGTLTLGAGEAVSIEPVTEGWGRVEVHAQEPITLEVSLEHETIEDYWGSANDGEGIYDDEHYTFLWLLPPGEGLGGCGQDSYFFIWWGSGDKAFWPTTSNARCGSSDTFELDAGEHMVLVAATNVLGYTLNLTTEDASDTSTGYDWTLGDVPGFGVHPSDPEHTATLDTELARAENRWTWHVEQPIEVASMVFTNAWTLREKDTVKVGTVDFDWVIYDGEDGPPEREQDPTDRSDKPSPYWAVLTEAFPGYLMVPSEPIPHCELPPSFCQTPPVFIGITPTGSRGLGYTDHPDPADPLVSHAELERNDVGVSNESYGTAIATIPYAAS